MRENVIYGATARFDGTARALTEDEIRAVAPSVFATQAHESRSERFRPIPTIEVLRRLKGEGFDVVGARQSVTRQADRSLFTKHLLRLRRLDDGRKYTVGDTALELLLKNANDGTSAYDLLAGLFRVQCLNSLVCQTGTIDTVKVRHSGDVTSKVIDASFRVVTEANKLLSAPAEWPQVVLAAEERQALAQAAHVLRFGDPATEAVTTPITPDQLLEVRRTADVGNDLWRTYNVVQENALKGGLTGIGRNVNGARVRRTTREIKGIDQDVRLNKALFLVANAIAKAKGHEV